MLGVVDPLVQAALLVLGQLAQQVRRGRPVRRVQGQRVLRDPAGRRGLVDQLAVVPLVPVVPQGHRGLLALGLQVLADLRVHQDQRGLALRDRVDLQVAVYRVPADHRDPQVLLVLVLLALAVHLGRQGWVALDLAVLQDPVARVVPRGLVVAVLLVRRDQAVLLEAEYQGHQAQLESVVLVPQGLQVQLV